VTTFPMDKYQGHGLLPDSDDEGEGGDGGEQGTNALCAPSVIPLSLTPPRIPSHSPHNPLAHTHAILIHPPTLAHMHARPLFLFTCFRCLNTDELPEGARLRLEVPEAKDRVLRRPRFVVEMGGMLGRDDPGAIKGWMGLPPGSYTVHLPLPDPDLDGHTSGFRRVQQVRVQEGAEAGEGPVGEGREMNSWLPSQPSV
jgi:hypothetical protein